jgi:transposase
VRYAGIDIASERHVVAIMDRDERVLLKPMTFEEDAEGYRRLFEALGTTDVLVCMEATGHYWKNLFVRLHSEGYAVALVNPLRTHRFMGEDLQRTKTDAIDALGVARFAAQKRPKAAALPDVATEELRELVRLHDRLTQEFGDKVRQLHRLVDLGFPEFTRCVKTLDSELAVAILAKYPTALAFKGVHPGTLAKLVYDGRHNVGLERAKEILAAAKVSVGVHHGGVYKVQVGFLCDDLNTLRARLKTLDDDISASVDKHDIAKLIDQLEGIGPTTAARIVAELGNPADFASPKQLASFVALVPALKQSGKHAPDRAGLTNIGHVRLRSALWMPMLSVVRLNPWIKAFYDRLIARGKLPKVALCASMRKLLVAIHWIAKHRQPFVPRLAPGT